MQTQQKLQDTVNRISKASIYTYHNEHRENREQRKRQRQDTHFLEVFTRYKVVSKQPTANNTLHSSPSYRVIQEKKKQKQKQHRHHTQT